MKTLVVVFFALSLLSIGSIAATQIVFFEEQFSGPTLDSDVWRTEIATSGVRWCDSDPGQQWGPGVWVDEGVACYGVAAYPPYGTANLSDGLLEVASDNGQACPYVVSRLPGTAQLFPPVGDFTAKVRMRYDRVTPWGSGVLVMQSDGTEPAGGNPPSLRENVLMQIWGSWINSSLGGWLQEVASIPSPYEMHEFALECIGTSFAISVDGQTVYGPLTSDLRPTAIWIGNPVLAYWHPTDWCEFSVDEIRIEVPGPIPVAARSWGAIKEHYR